MEIQVGWTGFTRNGYRARCICDDLDLGMSFNRCYVMAYYDDGGIESCGVFPKNTLSRNFTSMLWDQVPQDTLVSVSNDEIDWHTYRFHKFANNLYGVYEPEDFLSLGLGKLVNSNDASTIGWYKYCKLANLDAICSLNTNHYCDNNEEV